MKGGIFRIFAAKAVVDGGFVHPQDGDLWQVASGNLPARSSDAVSKRPPQIFRGQSARYARQPLLANWLADGVREAILWAAALAKISRNWSVVISHSVHSASPARLGADSDRANRMLPCCRIAPRCRRWALPQIFTSRPTSLASPTPVAAKSRSPSARRWKAQERITDAGGPGLSAKFKFTAACPRQIT